MRLGIESTAAIEMCLDAIFDLSHPPCAQYPHKVCHPHSPERTPYKEASRRRLTPKGGSTGRRVLYTI